MSNAVENSRIYFSSGYNCCQAVVKACVTNQNQDLLVKVASSFGGGIAGQRQVCGCVSAIAIVLGEKYGFSVGNQGEIKKEQNKKVKKACEEFEKVTGSIVCGELLGLPNFTKKGNKLPCKQMVELAVKIIEEN